jgi:hypothetical protein
MGNLHVFGLVAGPLFVAAPGDVLGRNERLAVSLAFVKNYTTNKKLNEIAHRKTDC